MNRNQSHFQLKSALRGNAHVRHQRRGPNQRQSRGHGLVLTLCLGWAAFGLALALVLALGASVATAAEPKVGEPAPAFEFLGVDGAVHSSAALYGETGVVVAWFPKAFTPG